MAFVSEIVGNLQRSNYREAKR